jgi:hypothetical protein
MNLETISVAGDLMRTFMGAELTNRQHDRASVMPVPHRRNRRSCPWV